MTTRVFCWDYCKTSQGFPLLVFRCDVDFKNSAAWEWLDLHGLNSVPCQSHAHVRAWESGTRHSFLLCPCTALCQRNQVSRGANTQSAGFGGGVGLGRAIFNPDHNNGLTQIMTTPQGIGMKGNSCAVNSCTRVRMRGWGKAVSSASWDSFAASTLCNFTLTACSSQPLFFLTCNHARRKVVTQIPIILTESYRAISQWAAEGKTPHNKLRSLEGDVNLGLRNGELSLNLVQLE